MIEFRHGYNSAGVKQPRLDTISILLAAIGPQLCQDAFNDWVGDALRQLEGTTFGHDFYSLTAGIAQHLARAALGEMQLEFLTDFWRDLILQIVTELSEEFVTCDH